MSDEKQVAIKNIDFVNNKDDLKQILDVIRTPFSGTKFFNPAI